MGHFCIGGLPSFEDKLGSSILRFQMIKHVQLFLHGFIDTMAVTIVCLSRGRSRIF